MFFADRNYLEAYEFDLTLVKLPMIKLPFKHHLFMCEILEFEPDNREQYSLTPCLVSSLECLTELANSNKLVSTFLISPAYMNNTQEWALNRLLSISRAEYMHENCNSYVYRYEIKPDEYIYADISGLNKNENELSFVSILKLEDRQC